MVYENVHESRAPGGLVKLVDKARTLNRSLQRASFEQVAMLLRKNKYLLAQARDWTAVDKRCVPTEDEPPVTANALLAPSSPYQRALEHVCSSAELDSDVYSVGLQLAALRQTFDVNTFSFIALATAALPDLEASHGAIVAVSSMAGKMGLPAVAAYSASKHGEQSAAPRNVLYSHSHIP